MIMFLLFLWIIKKDHNRYAVDIANVSSWSPIFVNATINGKITTQARSDNQLLELTKKCKLNSRIHNYIIELLSLNNEITQSFLFITSEQ
jgi:predicted DNA-binding protein (UPF0278 family)